MDENGRTGAFRQGVWNWLALAALLALGIVWAPDAPRAPAPAAHPGGARLAAAHAAGPARAALR